MARGRQYETTFILDAELESSFRKSFGAAADSIGQIDSRLQQLSRAGGFDRIERDARDAGKAISGLDGDTKTFGDTLRRVAEYTGAFTIVQGVADSVQNVFATIGEYENSLQKLQAATGASKEEMAEIEEITKSLYELPLGEGFADLSASIATVKQVTKQQGEALEQTTREAIVFRDVFGEDVPESIKAVDTMMKQFGITSTQAFNLLAQGAQNGLNKSNELLDTANEYAPQFAALGFNANQMFDIFSAGLEAGAWNLDKVGDVVKEFNIRLKDGSKGTYEAMAQLFAPDNVDEFAAALTKGGETSAEYLELLQHVSKDTAKTLVGNLKKGGNAAATAMTALQTILGDSEKVFKGLTDGSLTGAQAMQMVIERLQQIEDPLQRNQIGVALMGTQFEDLEQSVVAALGTARSQFDMTRETMAEVEAVSMDTLVKDFQMIGRQLMTDLVIPIAEELMPALQGIADWASENKDIVQFLALATPAALIGKNVIPVVKGFGKVEDAAVKAAKGASGMGRMVGSLGSALTFFTNPVGLAVGAIGALTLGVVAYKKHQEQARQELIHMGDALQESSKQYKEVADKAKLTNDLVWEYNELDKTIRNNTDATKDLSAEKQRLAEITAQLQQLHPETITQYDIETGKIKEKIKWAKMEADADEELKLLKMERDIAEKSRELPNLEKEIGELQKQTTELKKQNDAIDAAVPALKAYYAEYQKILQMDSSDEKFAKLDALTEKVRAVGSTVGLAFNHLGFLNEDTIANLKDKQLDTLNEYIKKSEELKTATSSYEALYQAQKELIELDLGGSFEEQAAKMKQLTGEEKARFDQALAAVIELNKEMDLLPTEKKINVRVTWQQTMKESLNPEKFVQNLAPEKAPSPVFLEGYADGGFATEPSIFGEGRYPEVAIPLNNSSRSQALLEATNRIMGHDAGGGVQIHAPFSPTIQINGGGGTDVAAQVRQGISEGYQEWKRNMERFMQEGRRLSFQ